MKSLFSRQCWSSWWCCPGWARRSTRRSRASPWTGSLTRVREIGEQLDYHWLSLAIIDYHWLSLIIIDYHCLSLFICKSENGKLLTDSLTTWKQEMLAHLKTTNMCVVNCEKSCGSGKLGLFNHSKQLPPINPWIPLVDSMASVKNNDSLKYYCLLL